MRTGLRSSKPRATAESGFFSARGSVAVALLLLVSATATSFHSRSALEQARAARKVEANLPPIYLPEVRYVRLLTAGYDTTASKLLWFSTINYFGKQFAAGDRDYRWLGEMCELVTHLDPKARHAFEFCATLLSWVAKEPQKSLALLDRAVAAEPEYWRYRYLRGFTNWYFLDRMDLAKDDFVLLPRLADSPPQFALLASRVIANQDSAQMAMEFLQQLVEQTADPKVKRKIGKRLRQAQLAVHLKAIGDASAAFSRERGRFPYSVDELVQSALLAEPPREPFGGRYEIDPLSGEVRTTSGKKPLTFAGKTAKTGVAKHEFQEQE